MRSQVKRMIEQALEAERDYHLQLGYYEHSPEFRMDYRNGYRLRDLATQLGLLRRLRVPRTRRRYRSQFLPRYKRAQPAVHELVRQAFLRGISTRQVGAVLEPVLGEACSAQTVSNLTRQLSRAAEQFHRRPLRADYLYLFLDGVVLKVRDVGREGAAGWCWWLMESPRKDGAKSSLISLPTTERVKRAGRNFCRIYISADCKASTCG